MKRTLSLLLVFALLLALAGCDGTSGGSSSSSESGKESSEMTSSSVSESVSLIESSGASSSEASSQSQSSSAVTSDPSSGSASSSSVPVSSSQSSSASSDPSSVSASQSSSDPSSSVQPEEEEEEPVYTGVLKFHAISCIDRGDALLIQTPWNKTILVDAGKYVSGKQVVGYLKEQGVTKIDAFVATHYHEDHTGGLGAVLDNFKVQKVYSANINLDNVTWGNGDYRSYFRNFLTGRDIETGYLSAGSKIELDPLVTIEVLAPELPYYDFTGQRFENPINNNLSIVLKITYDEVSFLLMGDALSDCENYLLESGYDLKADVLKAGHHGNNDATGIEFLNAVQPKYAVSCREVPYPQIASRLQQVGAHSFDTSSHNIVFTTNGKTISVETTPKIIYQ